MAKRIGRSGLRMYSTNYNGDISYFPTLKEAELDTRQFCEKSKFTDQSACFEVKEHELKNLTPHVLSLLFTDMDGSELRNAKQFSKDMVTRHLFRRSRVWGHFVYVPSTKIFAIAKNDDKGNIPDAEDYASDEEENNKIVDEKIENENDEDDKGSVHLEGKIPI
jgi:hypothetical protein